MAFAVTHFKHCLAPKHKQCSRSFLYWVFEVFNRIDKQYIAEVGPDRACAEWLLKNGAALRCKGSSEYWKDYNMYIKMENPQFLIEAVDATGSGIHPLGFAYFGGCKSLKEMKLNDCAYVNDRGLKKLEILKDTLTDFEMIKNKLVTDKGLLNLGSLRKLENVRLGELSRVVKKDWTYQELSKLLPNCKIQFD